MLNKSGRSVLPAAAQAGRTDLVKTLIEVGADPNRVIPAKELSLGAGWTSLMIAAAEGHGDVVSVLIQAGADVNARNALGRTALFFASLYGFTPIVTGLLSHGADPNIVPDDDKRWTALHGAAYNGHLATVNALLAQAADATLKDSTGKTAAMWAEAQGHDNIARILRDAELKK